MFKKGLLLTIIFLLIFSIGAFATDYKYTQESGAGFFVGTADKADALEDSNELRQIINDLGTLLDHNKMDGLYPKDLTTGGTIQIPEAGLKFSNAPVNNDIAAYIAGEMAWKTLAELSIQPLDTALTNISALTYVSPSFIKMTANDTYAVRTLTETKTDLSLNYVENLKVKLNGTAAPSAATDDITLGYTVGSRWFDVTNDKEYVCLDNTDGAAVWTETTQSGGGGTFTGLSDTPANYTGQAGKYTKVNAGETALEFGTPAGAGTVTTSGTPVQYDYARFTDATTIEGRSYSEMKTDLGYMTDLVDDTDPDLGGQMQAGAHSINFIEQVLTSGTAIAWNLGNSNKATLTAAHNFTITITAPSGALNAQVIITQDGTGTRVMDEIVTQKDEAIATTDVNTTTEIITVTVDIPTGARIRFKTSAADLPAPLVVDTIYYAIRNSATEIKVATTKANAHAGTAIDLTDQGTGTHTVQQLVKWTGGTLEVLSTAAGSEDILGLTYKTGDKQWYAQLSKNFQ
ncbi:MAG: hypothetical protein KAW56_11930 [Candidatus Marinimicrobia bacterium]|nr:hypothetical protein [Candidatus Neomarinimicrobiota bacterium]